jgi:hypothetical protein
VITLLWNSIAMPRPAKGAAGKAKPEDFGPARHSLIDRGGATLNNRVEALGPYTDPKDSGQ